MNKAVACFGSVWRDGRQVGEGMELMEREMGSVVADVNLYGMVEMHQEGIGVRGS